MSKKFYQNDEFRKLQSKWYDKLKKEGFEDIEWFDPFTGMGQGSPYLKTDRIPDSGQIRKVYHPELARHYHLCRNFLANGPFYPNLQEQYRNSEDLRRSFPSFIKFYRSLDKKYSRAATAAFEAYTDGQTIREISKLLRRLHHQHKLGKPPRQYKSKQPYSTFWVHSHIKQLKQDMVIFNRTHPEGINVWEVDQAEEAAKDWLPESNKAILGATGSEGGSI